MANWRVWARASIGGEFAAVYGFSASETCLPAILKTGTLRGRRKQRCQINPAQSLSSRTTSNPYKHPYARPSLELMARLNSVSRILKYRVEATRGHASLTAVMLMVEVIAEEE